MAKGKDHAAGKIATIRSERSEELVNFGLLLAQKREQLGLSQTTMARRIGIDQSRISRIEMGFGTPRDVETAQAYAICYQLNEQERYAWFQLLFGLHSRTVDADDHAPTMRIADLQPGTAWCRVAGLHFLNAAQSLAHILFWEDAIPLFRKAESSFGTTMQAAQAACEIANLYIELGAYARALEEVQRIETTYAVLNDPALEMQTTRIHGWIAHSVGAFPAAETWLKRCLTLTEQLGDAAFSTHAHHFLGCVYLDWGKTHGANLDAARSFQQAETHLVQAYKLHQIWGDQGNLAYDLLRHAQLLQAQNDWHAARQFRMRARTFAGPELINLNIDLEEAQIALRQGIQPPTLHEQIEGALNGWKEVRHAAGMANALYTMSLFHTLRSDADQAFEYALAARCLFSSTGVGDRKRQHEFACLAQAVKRSHQNVQYNIRLERLRERAHVHQGPFLYLAYASRERAVAVNQLFDELGVGGIRT